MPAATSHPTNEDLPKLRLRRNFLRLLKPAMLTKLARACRTDADRDDLQASLIHSADQTAKAPPYDPERVRRGTLLMALGAGLGLIGAVLAWWLKDQSVTGPTGVLSPIACLALVLSGAFLLIAGHEQRTSEHLPRLLKREQVAASHALVEITHENQRASSSAWAGLIASAFIVADAAVLLYLVVPLLLPSLTPIWQLVVVAAGSLIIGKLAGQAADSVARAIRRGQLLEYHETKASADDPEAHATARALRKHFDGAVGGHWPTSPSLWTKYAGALPGIAFLAATTGLLLGMRLVMGSSDTDSLAVGLVALLVSATTAFAIALKLLSECLVPEVAMAKRIAARFPSVEQFDDEMRADHEWVRMKLVEARKSLRAAAMPRRHDVSVAAPTYDLLGAAPMPMPMPTPTPTPTPKPKPTASSPMTPLVHRIGSARAPSVGGATPTVSERHAGSHSPAAMSHTSVRHAAHRSGGFRPNPDAVRR